MLFNSLDFAVFLPIVFLLYWWLGGDRIREQNILLVLASYVFYAWWDVRFLFLLILSTVVDYSLGIAIEDTDNLKIRKRYFYLSIVTNLGILGFFKYYDFFVVNFVEAFSLFGFHADIQSLHIILPVGISFYTFQTLSYTIDVYRRKMVACRDFASFSAYVSFFPQLVAGPIERATRLIPQFTQKRSFIYASAVDGSKQILWGFFKKLVIADNCAIYADMFFNNVDCHSGSALLLGAIFFTFQIYADFSGYTDIAIGTARLFGFDLMKNFNYPYFATSLADFWRKWHISLTSWFRDYIYIPLGGNKGSQWVQNRNIFIVFLVSGLWHGANWTFIVWGLLHALLFLPFVFMRDKSHALTSSDIQRNIQQGQKWLHMIATFTLVVLLWICFRADSITTAMKIYFKIFSFSLFTFPDIYRPGQAVMTLILIAFFMVIEWIGQHEDFAIQKILINRQWTLRWGFYSLLVFMILMYMEVGNSPFIYFQF